jgi:SAM-dependent methyltransferase
MTGKPTRGGAMKKVVNKLGDNPWMRAPFFWSGFLTVRLIYPVQYLVLRELMDCDSVLDLGCGRHSMVPILPDKTETVGVEFFEEHYNEAVAKGRHTRYVRADITKVDFPEKSFEAAVMLDVIEHLPKEEGMKLLGKMEKWATKKIVLFTPNGFLKQHQFDDNPLMEHQSGWEVDELKKLGFKVYGVRGFKGTKKEAFEHDHEKMREIDGISDLAQVFTYHFPKTAFQLFAVKHLDKK